MGKKINFLTVFLILLFISVSNVYIYFNKTKISISSFSVKDVSDKVNKLDISTILFLVQWVLILLVVISFYVKSLKHRKEKKKPLNIVIKRERGTGKTHTDLDDLYDLLKERKHIGVSDIVRIFKISTEKALEWCRILEEHDLSYIDYPTLSEPELIIKE